MIVVTGGAGFIGSNLVAALEERGRTELVVCDRLGTDEKWRNIAKRELADLIEPEDLLEFLNKNASHIEAVFHMGAISATTERDADLIARTNLRLSLELWDYCTHHGVRFVYASSAATYGDGAAGFEDDQKPEALAKLRPLNAYGWSKHAFDRRIARLVASGAKTPLQWAGLKFFNVYGPNELHKGAMASVVSKTHTRVRAGEPAVLFRSHDPRYTDGGQLRDFVHVDDCVAQMLWLLDTPGVSGLFNCGSGRARSFLDLTNAVFAALEKPPHIEWIDTPVEIRAKYQYFTEARMERVRRAGYTRAATSLEDGVRDYVQRFLEADDSYR
jgi:ADP-L-glycero-D-manno-heptose 6-epimerase